MAPETAAVTLSRMPVVLLPNTDTEVTMTRKISEQIRPYSMAVAPRASAAKRCRVR